MGEKIDAVKLGPQRPSDDYRIFKGSPAEFFQKAADDLKKHEKEMSEI